MDPKLKPIGTRACYGGIALEYDAPSIQLFNDDEYLLASGSNLRLYNDGAHTSALIQPAVPNSAYVKSATLSDDRSLLVVVVEMADNAPGAEERAKTLEAYVYTNMATQAVNPRKPKLCVSICLCVCCIYVYMCICVHLVSMRVSVSLTLTLTPHALMHNSFTYAPDERKLQAGWPSLAFRCCAFSQDNLYVYPPPSPSPSPPPSHTLTLSLIPTTTTGIWRVQPMWASWGWLSSTQCWDTWSPS